MTKASLVDEIDSLLPQWFIEWVAPHWFPPYIHVLRANPSTVHKVKLDPAWPVVDVIDYDGSAGSAYGGDQSSGAPEAVTVNLRRILDGVSDSEVGGSRGVGEAPSGIIHDEQIRLLLQVGGQLRFYV